MYCYKPSERIKSDMKPFNLPYEGESIEKTISRAMAENQPIEGGSPLVYTDRKDGVLPEMDIRADKWDLALNAMDKVNEAKRTEISKKLEAGTALESGESKE